MNELHPPQEPMLRAMRWIIRLAVRVLAALMTFVIVLGVADVVWELYRRLILTPPFFILDIQDLLATFGAFMAVLIAIEIFVNIVLYLRDDVIHVKIVVATALMAVTRKVIILDFAEVSAMEVLGLGAVVVATSVAYWIVNRATDKGEHGGVM
jgi:uncharacterized membrane protein (DUF373 family)